MSAGHFPARDAVAVPALNGLSGRSTLGAGSRDKTIRQRSLRAVEKLPQLRPVHRHKLHPDPRVGADHARQRPQQQPAPPPLWFSQCLDQILQYAQSSPPNPALISPACSTLWQKEPTK